MRRHMARLLTTFISRLALLAYINMYTGQTLTATSDSASQPPHVLRFLDRTLFAETADTGLELRVNKPEKLGVLLQPKRREEGLKELPAGPRSCQLFAAAQKICEKGTRD